MGRGGRALEHVEALGGALILTAMEDTTPWRLALKNITPSKRITRDPRPVPLFHGASARRRGRRSRNQDDLHTRETTLARVFDLRA